MLTLPSPWTVSRGDAGLELRLSLALPWREASSDSALPWKGDATAIAVVACRSLVGVTVNDASITGLRPPLPRPPSSAVAGIGAEGGEGLE
jgi:hypothetical protein